MYIFIYTYIYIHVTYRHIDALYAQASSGRTPTGARCWGSQPLAPRCSAAAARDVDGSHGGSL